MLPKEKARRSFDATDYPLGRQLEGRRLSSDLSLAQRGPERKSPPKRALTRSLAADLDRPRAQNSTIVSEPLPLKTALVAGGVCQSGACRKAQNADAGDSGCRAATVVVVTVVAVVTVSLPTTCLGRDRRNS